MKKTLLLGSVTVAFGMVVLTPSPVFAQATTTGFLDVTSVGLLSAGAPVTWSGVWSFNQTAFASANGVSDTETTSATAGPSSANSVASAPVVGLSGLFGLALGQINALPGGQFGSTSTGTLLESSFTTSAQTQLTISAAINSILTAQAGLASAVQYSQDSFSVTVDGHPLLAWSDSISAASGQTDPTDSQAPNLTDTFSVGAGSHDLRIQLGTGQAINPVAPVPEPSTLILFAGALLLLPFRKSIGKLVSKQLHPISIRR